MAKFYLSVWLRQKGDSLVALLPRWFFRAFLKTFKTHPELAEQVGFHVHPRSFDSPLPLMEEIDAAKLAEPRVLPGIDLRVASALTLLGELRLFAGELDRFPYDRDGQSPFWFSNKSFTDFDAAVLYSMLRRLKPRRYIELGCGFSSVISSEAIKRNEQDGIQCDAAYCDPDPRLPMTALACGRFVRNRVQDLPLEMFTQLAQGDVLFIDTSHVMKIQSDVEYELLRILPSLRPGVWIQVHDIFTPYDYPEDWVFRPLRLGVNEQYALECLLTGGKRYQVELPVHYLVRHHLKEMQELFPRGKQRGQSLWLKKME